MITRCSVVGMLALAAMTMTSASAWSQSPTPIWPSGRIGHVMVYDAARNETIMIGGDATDAAQTRDSLWTWSGTRWRVSGDLEPGWRTLPAMAFDSRRRRMVLYGGLRKLGARQYVDPAEDDTWEWDGTRWEERRVNSPGSLDHHAMAFDDARGVVVMQGGGSNGQILGGKTWTYNGDRWTLAADSNQGPGERVHHAMAYDKRRQRIVLYGGFGKAGPASGDVWEWDGRRWEQKTAVGPGPRSRHRLAFDEARGVIVLYGGNDSDRTTWTWDGTRWQNIPGDGPAATTMHAMTYDIQRQRVVLFGGGWDQPLSDLWEWNGARWEQVRRQ